MSGWSDFDRQMARCEAEYLREPSWREPSEEELAAEEAREALRAEEGAPAADGEGGVWS